MARKTSHDKEANEGGWANHFQPLAQNIRHILEQSTHRVTLAKSLERVFLHGGVNHAWDDSV